MRMFAVCAGAVGAAALALAGAGTAAAAPNLAGALYSDAKEELANQGLTPIIATRVGDKVEDDDCVVDRIQDSPASGDTVLVYLNCYANVASPVSPGYSAQSTLGRAALDAQEQAEEEAAAEAEANAAAEQEAES